MSFKEESQTWIFICRKYWFSGGAHKKSPIFRVPNFPSKKFFAAVSAIPLINFSDTFELVFLLAIYFRYAFPLSSWSVFFPMDFRFSPKSKRRFFFIRSKSTHCVNVYFQATIMKALLKLTSWKSINTNNGNIYSYFIGTSKRTLCQYKTVLFDIFFPFIPTTNNAFDCTQKVDKCTLSRSTTYNVWVSL